MYVEMRPGQKKLPEPKEAPAAGDLYFDRDDASLRASLAGLGGEKALPQIRAAAGGGKLRLNRGSAAGAIDVSDEGRTHLMTIQKGRALLANRPGSDPSLAPSRASVDDLSDDSLAALHALGVEEVGDLHGGKRSTGPEEKPPAPAAHPHALADDHPVSKALSSLGVKLTPELLSDPAALADAIRKGAGR